MNRTAGAQAASRRGSCRLGLEPSRHGLEKARARDGARRPEPIGARSVEIILARQLASQLSVPVLLVDARGDTLFYNEPAEAILGRRLDDVDAPLLEARATMLAPRAENGVPLPVDQLPGMLAMRAHRPAHALVHIRGLDGIVRAVEATAVPITSAHGQVLGALIAMWRRPAPPA